MSKINYTVIRWLASVVYLFVARKFRSNPVRFCVVTGSVGKTIVRRTIAQSIPEHTFTLQTDYVNEFGVLLSAFGFQNFSVSSYRDWYRLLTAKPITDKLVIIEMGADFRLDITWFMRRFKASTVIMTKGSVVRWIPYIDVVLTQRVELAGSVTEGSVFVASDDQVHRELLDTTHIQYSVVRVTDDVYSYAETVVPLICDLLGIPIKEVRLFNQDRLFSHNSEKLNLVSDVYKVTPVCLGLFIEKAKSCTVLIMSEIRPTVVSLDVLYGPIVGELQKFKKIIFVGDYVTYEFLKKRIEGIEFVSDLKDVDLVRLNQFASQGRLQLGVKTASRYRGDELCQSILKSTKYKAL